MRELGISSFNRRKRNVRVRVKKATIVHNNLVNQNFKTHSKTQI